jgi:hypothetical protein
MPTRPIAPQRGRGHFPEDGATGHGKAPELRELAASSNLSDACCCRVGTSQRRAGQVQSSQQKIAGTTHAQEFGAAHPQRALWHADSRAKRGHARPSADTRDQCILEPDHDVGVMSPGFEIDVGIIGRQAIDEHVKQFSSARATSGCAVNLCLVSTRRQAFE